MEKKIYIYRRSFAFLIPYKFRYCKSQSKSLWTSKAGEKQITWALQNGDDTTTRVNLPAFISDVLEINVCQYVSAVEKWQKRIDQRLHSGKCLTKSQQASYDAWKLTLEPTFVFSKAKKTLVHDPKRVTQDCIALTLHLHEDAENLAISSSQGTRYRLVLLSGAPSESPLPAELEGVVPSNMMPQAEAAAPQLDEDDDQDVLCDDEQLCMDKNNAEQMDQASQASDEDDVQVLGDTDDEVEDYALPSHVPKVRDFNSRQSWKDLTAQGLILLPRHVKGCSISYHKSGQQWQGFYPNVHIGMSSTWGGSTKRTEHEALLRVCRAIIQAHIATNPKDKAIWKVQLEKIQKAEGTAAH